MFIILNRLHFNAVGLTHCFNKSASLRHNCEHMGPLSLVEECFLYITLLTFSDIIAVVNGYEKTEEKTEIPQGWQ